ncbi:MAG: ferrous iron transport protein B, partial [Planctomycetaceae bacterium]|nr:ferrous iron transport protein B [Planctomycetaceae bacterium]
PCPCPCPLIYGNLEPLIENITATLSQKEYLAQDFSPRWLALKLLENDREARRIVQHHIHEGNWEPLLDACTKHIEQYEKDNNESPRKTIAACRNQKAEEIASRVAERVIIPKRKSDAIDRIVCRPVLGLFAVALVMFITFQLAFNISGEWEWIPFIGTSPVGLLESVFSDWIPALLDKTLALPDGVWKSLIYDGIVGGVGGVLVFVPVIFFIFLFVSLLNQSGYMARMVVVLDRLMRVFGLHGQSVLPLILGGGLIGGCAVPAIMATRTMREPKERLLTILVIPLMNCGAKVPVYALLIAAFFSAYQGLMMAFVIFVSWFIALVCAAVLGRTLVKGDATPLLIELPTYQMPGVFETVATACRQSWMFIKKAGTFILAVNVLLWALMYFPSPENPDASDTERLQGSYAAMAGKVLEPVSLFAGFDWRDNIALLGGFAAKEVIVSSLSTIYGIEENGVNRGENVGEGDSSSAETEEPEQKLAERLQAEKNWSPVKAFAMLLFVMIYAPCLATCAVIWRETGYVKYMLAATVYTTVLAMLLATAVYQIGSLFV